MKIKVCFSIMGVHKICSTLEIRENVNEIDFYVLEMLIKKTKKSFAEEYEIDEEFVRIIPLFEYEQSDGEVETGTLEVCM